MFQQFLAASDASRASRTLEKLARHDISRWALTGGFAVEIHHLQLGRPPFIRPLNDFDVLAGSFDCIPATLGDDFLFRHIHPLDPPGKTMLQLIDPDSALPIHVFRAFGRTMSRTARLDLPSGTIELISLEDLVARAARLALDLTGNVPTPSKYARDFLRLAELVNPADVEEAWRDQRKPGHPETFDEANTVLQDLIPARHDLLITPDYSKDTADVCPRCAPTPAFALADPNVVLSLLGYC
jgi:hypothetical protein